MISKKPHTFVIFASLLLLGLTAYVLLIEPGMAMDATTEFVPASEDSLWQQTVSMIQDSVRQFKSLPR